MITQQFSSENVLNKSKETKLVNERIELFEHFQASSVCLKADCNGDFTGVFQNWIQIWIYQGESYFLQIYRINLVGHHARFGAIMVQWYGKGAIFT